MCSMISVTWLWILNYHSTSFKATLHPFFLLLNYLVIYIFVQIALILCKYLYLFSILKTKHSSTEFY